MSMEKDIYKLMGKVNAKDSLLLDRESNMEVIV